MIGFELIISLLSYLRLCSFWCTRVERLSMLTKMVKAMLV